MQSFKKTGNDATITVGNVATSASGLCRLDFAPSNSTIGARIECHASEDFSTVANRTADLVFVTRKDGTHSERLRISSTGLLTVKPADTSSSYATTDGGIDNAITISSTGTSSSQSIGISFNLNKSGETGAISEIGAIREGNGLSGLVFRTRDNSTGRNERLRITSDGKLLVGTSNLINTSSSKFQVAANDATGSAILARFNASVYSSYLDFYKSRSNTLGTAYVVNDDDHLGAIRYYAADGSNSGYTTAAEIYGSCDGGSGAAGDMPGRITFHTRPDGAGQSMQERLRIDSDGQVQIGSGTIHGGGHLTIRGGGVNTYACQDYQYVGTPSDDDAIAQIRFTANTTGGSVVQGAKIQAVADADWGASGDAPTRLEFHTAPNGSATMAERLRITELGDIYAGNADVGGYPIFDSSTINPRYQFRPVSYTHLTLPTNREV